MTNKNTQAQNNEVPASDSGALLKVAHDMVTKMQVKQSEAIWELFPSIADRVQLTYAQLKESGKKINHHDYI